MRLLAAALALLLLSSTRSHASPPFGDDSDCGRIGIGPLFTAGLGDATPRARSTGLRAIAFPTADVAVGAELRTLDPDTRTASLDLGYRIARGKVAGFSLTRLDLFASAGLGATWADDTRVIATAALSARFRLSDHLALELGLHDTITVDVEASLSLTILSTAPAPAIPDHGGRRNPLEGQPAIRD
jgi:hypothetical protein